MWIYFSLLFFGTPSTATHPTVFSLSLFLVCLPRFPRSLFFIPNIRVIRIESFNKKFCSPAESAPFCEFKWKSGRESGRGCRPGGRRALLACKLKCCHLNANKTPPRVESSVEKEGGGQRRGRKRDRKREGEWQKVRRERTDGKPGLTDRATEVLTRSKRKFRKEFLFHPSRASNYTPTFGVDQIWHCSPVIRTTKFLSFFSDNLDFILSFMRLLITIYIYIIFTWFIHY